MSLSHRGVDVGEKIGDRVGLSHRGVDMDGRLVRLTVRLGWSLRVADLGEFRIPEWGERAAHPCPLPDDSSPHGHVFFPRRPHPGDLSSRTPAILHS